MLINILLPYKEKFSKNKASSVSLTVANNLQFSKYKKQIRIFGHNVENPMHKKNFITPLHESTQRNYLERMNNNKVECMEKAKKYGMGMVAVRNSTHYGIAGYYTMMAAEEGMIGITGTNARPSIAPTFGVENMLGTNPMVFGIPTTDRGLPLSARCLERSSAALCVPSPPMVS